MTAALDAIQAPTAHVLAHSEIVELEINPLLLTETRAIVADPERLIHVHL